MKWTKNNKMVLYYLLLQPCFNTSGLRSKGYAIFEARKKEAMGIDVGGELGKAEDVINLEVQGEDDIVCCWECIDKVLEIMA